MKLLTHFFVVAKTLKGTEGGKEIDETRMVYDEIKARLNEAVKTLRFCNLHFIVIYTLLNQIHS